MNMLEDYLQHNWAVNQVCAEQSHSEKADKNAAFYAGRASAYRDTLLTMGLKTNEDIYVDQKLKLKKFMESNQMRGFQNGN